MKPTDKAIKRGLEILSKTGVCPACGFRVNGVLRWHNMDGECWLMENISIRKLFNTFVKVKE